ncbi:MAG: hypothetical protein QJR07_03245 [Acetobacteraceae bacterium]|nr:hypothetical protein [Acetobacteraceae bacterium]
MRSVISHVILRYMRILPLLRISRKTLPLLAFLMIGACTQYQRIPPDTPEGRACVAQCGMMRSQCVSQQNFQLQQCNMMRSAALASYNRCRASGGGSQCVMPPVCTGGDYQCNRPYDDCFVACGGRLVPIK